LLRVIAGLQRPQEGAAMRAAGITLVVSSINPPPDVSPRELIDYGLALRRPWWRLSPDARDAAAADSALTKTGLTERADSAVATMSAGEVQRAWIAAAIAAAPAALLIDEPTTHLDLRYQIEVLRMLADLRSDGIAIAAALHDLTLAGRFADTIALLSAGRLVCGPPHEVLKPDAIAEAFDVDVTVHRHPADGYPICLPK
jgi:ABC-type cobalamin/Fe3+-siderophores transport system ATPase subunit